MAPGITFHLVNTLGWSDLRALLNNLHPRLSGYAGWVGRRGSGWHLLAVLERLERLAGRRLQRVGMTPPWATPRSCSRG